MFALAIVLLIAAAALVLWVIFGLNDAGNNKIHFDGFGITADLSPLTLFLLGALALLLVWAATRLIAAGTKRGMRKRRERKTLEKEHKLHEKDRLAAERDRDALRDERRTVLGGGSLLGEVARLVETRPSLGRRAGEVARVRPHAPASPGEVGDGRDPEDRPEQQPHPPRHGTVPPSISA